MTGGEEEAAKRSISTWIGEHSGAEIFWEQENEKYPVFRVKGTNAAKPDILVSQEHQVVAIEMKDGDDSSDIYNGAVELHQYLESYANDDAKYIANGEEHAIDVFLLATQHSKEGRLFKEERETRIGSKGRGKRWAIVSDKRESDFPWYEWNRTEAVSRMQMRYAKNLISGELPGIGVLLSTTLDKNNSGRRPKMLYYKTKSWNWEKLSNQDDSRNLGVNHFTSSE